MLVTLFVVPNSFDTSKGYKDEAILILFEY